MSRDHVSLVSLHSSPEVEVYRACELETVSTENEVTIAIAVFDRRKCDISITPCGPWSGERVIRSVRGLFDTPGANAGRMPAPPYGGKRMLYLLAELNAKLADDG